MKEILFVLKIRHIVSTIFALVIIYSLSDCSKQVTPTGTTQKATVQPKQEDLGEFAWKVQGAEPRVDITQFTRTITDVPYAEQSQAQVLDIIYPDKGSGPYRVIVGIHGGGWKSGDKRMQSFSSLFKTTSQGYAFVTINYRLSGEAHWPAQLNDAKAAIRFLRANASKYELDTENILVWGSCAGGHIAEMLGATNGRQEFEDLTMGNQLHSSSVQGVVSWYGMTDLSDLATEGISAANAVLGYDARKYPERSALASPINFITKEYPPALFVHGTNDKVVSYLQSVEMCNMINQLAGPGRAQIKLFPGASHGSEIIKTDENLKDNLNFVDQVLWGGKNPYRTEKLIMIRMEGPAVAYRDLR